MVRKWSQEIVDYECSNLINTLGDLPSGQKMMKMGHNDLFMAIKRYGGGFNATRSRLGLGQRRVWTINRQPRTDEEIINESKRLHDELGHFPSIGWLQENDYAWLSTTIARRFGGTRKFQEQMGFKSARMINSKNGEKWDSKAEASVSNFFTDNGIEHERGNYYPDGSTRTFDFYLPEHDLHIELWGDFNEGGPIPIKEEYTSRRELKEQFHLECSLNIICLEYRDAISNKRLNNIFSLIY